MKNVVIVMREKLQILLTYLSMNKTACNLLYERSK